MKYYRKSAMPETEKPTHFAVSPSILQHVLLSEERSGSLRKDYEFGLMFRRAPGKKATSMYVLQANNQNRHFVKCLDKVSNIPAPIKILTLLLIFDKKIIFLRR